jgi:hypothetical protein
VVVLSLPEGPHSPGGTMLGREVSVVLERSVMGHVPSRSPRSLISPCLR